MKSTRRGSFSVHRSEKNARFEIQLNKRPLSPGTSRSPSLVHPHRPWRRVTGARSAQSRVPLDDLAQEFRVLALGVSGVRVYVLAHALLGLHRVTSGEG